MWSRSDLPQRNFGLAELKNMNVTIQGSAISRHGNFVIADGYERGSEFLSFDLVSGDYFSNDSYLVGHERTVYGLGAGDLTIYDHEGIAITGAYEYFQDNHFEEGDTYWPNGDGTVVYKPHLKTAEMTNSSGTNKCWMYQYIGPVLAGLGGEKLHFSVSGDGDCYVRVGTTLHGFDIYGPTLHASGFHIITLAGTGVGDIWIEFRNEGATLTHIDIIDPHLFEGTAVDAVFPAKSMAQDTISGETNYVHSAMNEQDSSMVMVSNNRIHGQGAYPQELSLSGGTFTIGAIVFNLPPADWASSATRPASCCFFQGRLWFVGKDKIWASQSGDYYNFDIGTALDNEAISIPVNVRGHINWIMGQNELIIGTKYGEYAIRSDGGVITPTDIRVDIISAFGSTQDQPIRAGDRILFISRDRKKIRSAYYDEFKKGWNLPNISVTGEHITSNKIKRLAYAKDPDDSLFCLMENGVLAACTYEQYLSINAWSTYGNDAIVSYSSIAVVIGAEITELFMMSNYIDDTGNEDNYVISVSHLEELDHPHMDNSYIRPVEAGGIISNLDHSEGAVVTVIVDEELYHSTLVVDASKQIQLTGITEGVAFVGMAYVQKLKTLPLDLGSQGGSSAGMMKHINKIFARIYNSYLPLINGVRAPDRDPETGMGYAEPFISDDVEVTSMGRSKRSQITIEQDLPFHLEVTGLFGEVGQKGL